MVWKILATLVITVSVLSVLFFSNNMVSGFFSSVTGKFSDVIKPENASESQFMLVIDSYERVEREATDPVNIEMKVKRFQTKIGGASLSVADKEILITNYKGWIDIQNKNITLNGSFEMLKLPEASFANGTIEVRSEFDALKLENFHLKGFAMNNASGTLVMGPSESRFHGTLTIDSASGTFEFGKNLTIKGTVLGIKIS